MVASIFFKTFILKIFLYKLCKKVLRKNRMNKLICEYKKN